nr:hypothetical protein Iba_chr12bCG18240 [Ipomoea batatas]GMD72718.1 hypothetical protein Iba_chr12fCG11330 [Ipomoea batatas]
MNIIYIYKMEWSFIVCSVHLQMIYAVKKKKKRSSNAFGTNHRESLSASALVFLTHPTNKVSNEFWVKCSLPLN